MTNTGNHGLSFSLKSALGGYVANLVTKHVQDTLIVLAETFFSVN